MSYLKGVMLGIIGQEIIEILPLEYPIATKLNNLQKAMQEALICC